MAEEKPQKGRPQEEAHEVLVRILGHDVKGSKSIGIGLLRIKGVGWSIANAACLQLGIDRTQKVSTLSKEDIANIEKTLRSLNVPTYMKNRPMIRETGDSTHLFGIDLDMTKEFDIKRLKQIKAYKGVRHTFKLPVRGQRTRSNFRRSGVVMGVKKPKQGKKS